MLRSKITNAFKEENTTSKKRGLPTGKKYHCFFSHKNQHSQWGELSESITVSIGDALDIQFGLRGFLDVDDLAQISLHAICEGILESQVCLVLLNNEALDSQWCVAEWECARYNNAPLICIVNQEKFHVRPIITQYIEAGYDYLFASQGLVLSSFCFPSKVSSLFQ